MRVIATLLGLALAASAQAQTVTNGDFETGDLTGWTDESSTLCAAIGGFCDDGAAEVISEADAGVVLAGDYALFLYSGDQDGWQPTSGAAASDLFLVTRSFLAWDQAAEEDLVLEIALFDASGTEVGARDLPASLNGPSAQDIEVAAACGRQISARVQAQPRDVGDWEPLIGTAVFDGFRLQGDACPAFQDLDGDGFCENGIDANGDGDCASAGEPTLDPQDCDDSAAGVNPDAAEIGGNGIDEDCDGADGAATGTATGGTATGGTATGGTATGGTGTGSTVPNEVDKGKDEDDTIRASGAGCGCSTDGSPVGGLWVLGLGLLGLRRRR